MAELLPYMCQSPLNASFLCLTHNFIISFEFLYPVNIPKIYPYSPEIYQVCIWHIIVWYYLRSLSIQIPYINCVTGYMLNYLSNIAKCGPIQFKYFDVIRVWLKEQALEVKRNMNSKPSLQRQHLVPQMLSLTWISCCKEYLMGKMMWKQVHVLFFSPNTNIYFGYFLASPQISKSYVSWCIKYNDLA